MAFKYFKKELASNPFYYNNQPVTFEVNSSNQGVLRFDDTKDDPKLAEALHLAIEQHRGGIALINEEEYEAIKKNENGKVSAVFLQPEKLRPLPPMFPQKKAAAAAEANSPVRQADRVPKEAGQVVDTTPFRPASGQPVKTKTEAKTQ